MTLQTPDSNTITRRRWVKRFMLGTVASLAGPRWMGTVLADVTQIGPGPAVIRLKAADVSIEVSVTVSNPQTGVDETTVYQTSPLAAPGGSVQYSFSSAPPFTLNRVDANRFVTLDSICKHNGCTVARYKKHIVGGSPTAPVIQSFIECPCHGSRYDIEGRVIRGPAQADLSRFETAYDSATDIVSITIPDLKLHIHSIAVQQQGPGAACRLKLVFPVTIFSKYEIRYHEDLEGQPAVVPFSTTSTGPANQTSVFTNFLNFPPDGNFTAYVDSVGPRGFFVVGLVLGDVPSMDEVAP